MHRIAIITDTHDHLPPDLPERLAAADEIWHLGDVCEPEVLAGIQALGKPLQVILGNNEEHALWPLTLLLEREGTRCFLVHIPPRHAPPGVQLLLHGHTHVPRDETDPDGVRWLNPGAISHPRQGSVAGIGWLTLKRGRAPQWRVVPL